MTRLPGHRDALADLSDQLTRALRDHNLTAVAHVRDQLDTLAGRTPWEPGDPPRPATPEDCLRTNPTGPNPTPHDSPTGSPRADGEWYVVRITSGTWAQHITGRHHYRGTADLHAAVRTAAAWLTGRRHTYDVWASHIHNTVRPDPAPLHPRWSNP